MLENENYFTSGFLGPSVLLSWTSALFFHVVQEFPFFQVSMWIILFLSLELLSQAIQDRKLLWPCWSDIGPSGTGFLKRVSGCWKVFVDQNSCLPFCFPKDISIWKPFLGFGINSQELFF